MQIENAQQLALVVLGALVGIFILFKVGKVLFKIVLILLLLAAIAYAWQWLGTL